MTVGHRRRPRGWVDDAGRPVRRCSASLAPQIGRLCRLGGDPGWRGPWNLSVPWGVSGRLAITREGRIANSCPLALSRPALAAVGCAGPAAVSGFSRSLVTEVVTGLLGTAGSKRSPLVPAMGRLRSGTAGSGACGHSQPGGSASSNPTATASQPGTRDVSAGQRFAGTSPVSVFGPIGHRVVTETSGVGSSAGVMSGDLMPSGTRPEPSRKAAARLPDSAVSDRRNLVVDRLVGGGPHVEQDRRGGPFVRPLVHEDHRHVLDGVVVPGAAVVAVPPVTPH